MDNKNKEHHITGYNTYIIIWLALLALTSITVSVAGMDLGMLALPIALAIATIKSLLVLNIFMHIKFDEPIFKVFISISVITLAVIFLLTFIDVINR